MKLIRTGAIMMAIYVVLSAFGAHAIKDKIPILHFETYQTASNYLAIHAISIILLGIIALKTDSKSLNKISIFFILGIINVR